MSPGICLTGFSYTEKCFSPERMRKSHLPGTRRNTNFASQTKQKRSSEHISASNKPLKNTVMKRLILTLTILCTTLGAAAMSKSKIRTSARFLTDRMAYELDLTPRQYDDFYEINYDFLYEANLVMDDVMRGYRDAIYYYYTLLDRRNEDASYVLTYYQYRKFMQADYFYRPIFSTGKKWNLRIYVTYTNHKFFYYDAPSHYNTYRGEHGRKNYSKGYYTDRYKNQDRYTNQMRISGSQNFSLNLKNDFGVNMRDRNEELRYNNYSNSNQPNRTQDERYRDVSGNKNSPQINNRNSSSGTVTSGRRGSTTQTTQTQTSTRTGRGTRTESVSTSTRNSNSSSTRTTQSNTSSTTTRAGRR